MEDIRNSYHSDREMTMVESIHRPRPTQDMISSMNASVEDATTSPNHSFLQDQRDQSESHAPSSTRDQSEMRKINSF